MMIREEDLGLLRPIVPVEADTVQVKDDRIRNMTTTAATMNRSTITGGMTTKPRTVPTTKEEDKDDKTIHKGQAPVVQECRRGGVNHDPPPSLAATAPVHPAISIPNQRRSASTEYPSTNTDAAFDTPTLNWRPRSCWGGGRSIIRFAGLALSLTMTTTTTTGAPSPLDHPTPPAREIQ